LELAVIGSGHVGLITATCLAATGHRVRAQDVDKELIARLAGGEPPFLEPALPELLWSVTTDGRLSFHLDQSEAVSGASLIFLCVDTPNTGQGAVDISSLVSAAMGVLQHAEAGAAVVNRSTAPVGTATYLRSLAEEIREGEVAVAVNPEFLAEGAAIGSFLAPDRLVIGAWDCEVAERILRAYGPIVARALPPDLPIEIGEQAPGQVPVVTTDPQTAELIKYAANAFLAMKISFINEMAGIADDLGADITLLARAVGLDHRIGTSFLRAGIGWGGSCFPKDIEALQAMAETRGLAARMLRAAHDVNVEQQRWVMRKLQLHLKTLVGRKVGLLGLAFKPNTDDLRNAVSLEIASVLAGSNVRVRAYDPAIKALPIELRETIQLADDPLSLAGGADALVVVTEWPEFAHLDLHQLAAAMRVPLLLDGRNLIDPGAARAAGFMYAGVGR